MPFVLCPHYFYCTGNRVYIIIGVESIIGYTISIDGVEYLSLGIFILALLLAVSLHEAMHAYASNYLGDDTARLMGRLTLNPLKHIDVFSTIILPLLLFLGGLPVFGAAKPVVFNPNRVKYDEFGVALVAAAGPLTNLALAVVSGLSLRFVSIDVDVLQLFLELFFQINLGFFVFNMIPFPPLDGSRLLYAISPDPIRDLLRRIESFGLVAVFAFILLFYSFISVFVGNAIGLIGNFIIGSQYF